MNNNIQEYISLLNNNGYVIIPDLVRGDELKNLQSEIYQHLEVTPNAEGLFWGFKTKRMSRVFSKSKQAQDLALHPLITDIMNNILGPFCERIQINLTQVIQIGSGENIQVIHRDDEVFPMAHPGMEFMVNAMWAIDDFTAENGGTIVWPGSHKKPSTREVPEEELIHAEMKKGSVLIWLGSMQHCGGANKTSTPRTGLTISYSLGWLRQAENQYLAYPPHIAKDFPEQLQDLIGYKVHRPSLGWYEGQEPDLLFQGRPETLPAKDLFTPELEAIAQKMMAGT